MQKLTDFTWSLQSLVPTNARVLAYLELDEHTVVGGQGECKRAKVHLRDGPAQGRVENVAIKRLTNVFADVDDAKRAFRELTLLYLVKHPNLIQLFDVLLPSAVEMPLTAANLAQNVCNLDQLYFVTKFGGNTLHMMMKRRNLAKQRWKLREIGTIIGQILAGLDYLHRAGVVHRDLKVNNIVLDPQGFVKILDFGCGRSVGTNGTMMTPNVMVPYYRPPEIFLGINSYDTKVDIWSVGCILAELILGRRLFNGNNFERQWHNFVSTLGTPDLSFVEEHPAVRKSYLAFIRQLERMEPIGWRNLMPDELFDQNDGTDDHMNPENVRDLLSRMLVFDAGERITAHEALRHPFFGEFLVPSGNEFPTFHYDFSAESRINSVGEWKEEILKLIAQCKHALL